LLFGIGENTKDPENNSVGVGMFYQMEIRPPLSLDAPVLAVRVNKVHNIGRILIYTKVWEGIRFIGTRKTLSIKNNLSRKTFVPMQFNLITLFSIALQKV